MHGACPVCNKTVDLNRQRSLKDGKNRFPWFCSRETLFEVTRKGDGRDPHSDRNHIHWACEQCLSRRKAILGNPIKQKFCDCYPYYAYADEERICEECRKTYMFDKEEQKHWYEELDFWVQSRPKKCKTCYKKSKT